MNYEVREVKARRKFVGFGVFRVGSDEPVHVYPAKDGDDADLAVAHRLALLMTHDLEDGVE